MPTNYCRLYMDLPQKRVEYIPAPKRRRVRTYDEPLGGFINEAPNSFPELSTIIATAPAFFHDDPPFPETDFELDDRQSFDDTSIDSLLNEIDNSFSTNWMTHTNDFDYPTESLAAYPTSISQMVDTDSTDSGPEDYDDAAIIAPEFNDTHLLEMVDSWLEFSSLDSPPPDEHAFNISKPQALPVPVPEPESISNSGPDVLIDFVPETDCIAPDTGLLTPGSECLTLDFEFDESLASQVHEKQHEQPHELLGEHKLLVSAHTLPSPVNVNHPKPRPIAKRYKLSAWEVRMEDQPSG